MNKNLAKSVQVVLRANKIQREHPTWRWGQSLFNALMEIDETLAETLRGTEIDPFHNTSVSGDFLEAVKNSEES